MPHIHLRNSMTSWVASGYVLPFLLLLYGTNSLLSLEHAYASFMFSTIPTVHFDNAAANYDAGVFESCDGDDE